MSADYSPAPSTPPLTPAPLPPKGGEGATQYTSPSRGLGDYTRRGEGVAFPPSRSYPTLLGEGAAWAAAQAAQLVTWCALGRIQRPISLRVGVGPDQDTNARETIGLLIDLPETRCFSTPPTFSQQKCTGVGRKLRARDEGTLSASRRRSWWCRPHVARARDHGLSGQISLVKIGPRSRAPAPWTCSAPSVHVVTARAPVQLDGWTDHSAHDLQGALVSQTDRHDRCRSRADRPRDRQLPGRPHLSRCDHPHHARMPSVAQCTAACGCHDVRRES